MKTPCLLCMGEGLPICEAGVDLLPPLGRVAQPMFDPEMTAMLVWGGGRLGVDSTFHTCTVLALMIGTWSSLCLSALTSGPFLYRGA